MMNDRELSEFQIQCEAKLSVALNSIGTSIEDRKLDGVSETYITGLIPDDITFWIYVDGADFKTPKIHPVFEKEDYSSLDELSDDFISQLVDEIK